MRSRTACAILALFTSPALGQEPPEAAPAGPSPAEAAAEEGPESWAEGYVWRDVTPSRVSGRGFSSVAVSPADPDRLVAVDDQGGVWLSTDQGDRWRRSLAPLAATGSGFEEGVDEEELLLQAEALAEDIFAEEIDLSGGDELEAIDEDEVAEEASEQIGTVLSDEGAAVDQMVQQARDEDAQRAGGFAWFHPEQPDRVLISRGDGLWASDNGGERFSRIAEQAWLSSIALGPDGLLVAGVADAPDPDALGPRYSVNGGRSWIRASGPLDGRALADLDHDAGAGWFYAAADDGLYRSADGESWSRSASHRRPLREILVDPNLSGGLWVADPQDVLRSDDAGEMLLPLARHPLPETVVMVAGARAGQVLLGGADGIWETTDGGVSWHPVSYGLPEPQVRDLVLADRPLLASTAGLFRLERSSASRAAPSEPEDLPDLGVVLDAALSRPGMDPSTVGLGAGRTVARRLVPEFRIIGEGYYRYQLAADYPSLTNSSAEIRYWRVRTQFVWGGGQSGSAGEASFDIPTSDLFVIGSQVYAVGDDQAVAAAGANISGEATQYRTLVADTLSDLYFTRVRLAQGRAQLPPDDLRARVLHELEIDEIDAMLDGYTDDAFSRAQR